jgi:hypothetical protein
MAQRDVSEIPEGLIALLRDMAPKRTLTYAEALTVARLQALRLRKLLGLQGPHADLTWITRLPHVIFKVLPKHEIRELARGAEASGITKRLRNGDYFMGITKQAAHTHRRFTAAHEIKHLLDYPYNHTMYDRLGYGDDERNHKQRERIADHFAAHFLVPDALLKQAWSTGLQDRVALAGLFAVSEDTMRIRLEQEGFLDSDDRPAETFLRRVGLVPELENLKAAS